MVTIEIIEKLDTGYVVTTISLLSRGAADAVLAQLQQGKGVTVTRTAVENEDAVNGVVVDELTRARERAETQVE